MFSVQFKHAGEWVTVSEPFLSEDQAKLYTGFMFTESRVVPFSQVCSHPKFEREKCVDCGSKCEHWDWEENVCMDCGKVDDREPDYMDIAHRHAEDQL